MERSCLAVSRLRELPVLEELVLVQFVPVEDMP